MGKHCDLVYSGIRSIFVVVPVRADVAWTWRWQRRGTGMGKGGTALEVKVRGIADECWGRGTEEEMGSRKMP